jgi:hypothetical protein
MQGYMPFSASEVEGFANLFFYHSAVILIRLKSPLAAAGRDRDAFQS